MFIRSERLFLRPAWPEDVDEFEALLDGDATMSNIANGRWPASAAEACAALGGKARDPLLPALCMTLPNGSGGPMIGAIGLQRDGDDVALGYWIAAGHWGRGYAAEAARAMLRLACILGHRRVVARHAADNAAAARVLTLAGFSREAGGGRRVARYSATLDCLCTGDNGAADQRAA